MWNRLWRLESVTRAQENAIVFALGLVSVLALSPFGFFPVLLGTFFLFYQALEKALTTRRAFFVGWLFAFGYFLGGLYWIAWALFVDIANNWWVLPFAMAGLPALMAAYVGCACAAWHRLAWRGTARVLVLIILLALAEWVRGFLFTGFPWNLWGYGFGLVLPLFQGAALVGLYGLSLVMLLLAFVPVLWLMPRHTRSGRVLTILIVGTVTVMGVWGMARISHYPAPDPRAPLIRLVQPNIPQTVKWDPAEQLRHEETLWSLTTRQRGTQPAIIIWPETAQALMRTDDVRRFHTRITENIRPDTILITGTLEAELLPDMSRRYVNRVAVYDHTGARQDYYDKSHLVPFGEYLPFQEWWPVEPVAFQGGQFSPGKGVTTMSVKNLPRFSPLVCYEVLFPRRVVDQARRPDWIVNVTNDAWYGATSGPYQHLNITQARAIEEGLPVARAANTGVSAMIDATGKIVAHLDLNTGGVLDVPLPAKLPPTLYARFGNSVFFAMLGGLWLVAWRLQRRTIRRVDKIV